MPAFTLVSHCGHLGEFHDPNVKDDDISECPTVVISAKQMCLAQVFNQIDTINFSFSWVPGRLVFVTVESKSCGSQTKGKK